MVRPERDLEREARARTGLATAQASGAALAHLRKNDYFIFSLPLINFIPTIPIWTTDRFVILIYDKP